QSHGASIRRPHDRRRRSLFARLDSPTGARHRGRLPADHAEFQRTGERRTDGKAARLSEIAERGTGVAAMSAITAVELPERKPTNYLEEGHTVWSWLTTTDHKRVGILYALSITLFFFI